jgi:CheY-like chemotaxis protein
VNTLVAGEAAIAEANGGSPVLLNVQPCEVTQYLRARAFRAAGYEVVNAASGADALTAVRQYTPSVALLDARLPDIDTFDLCETLKRLHPYLVVVTIAPRPNDADPEHAPLLPTADAYAHEPITIEELVALVGSTLVRTSAEANAWVISDDSGIILDVSTIAARLLNGTIRGLCQRNLLMFFERDRDSWRTAVVRACSGERVLQLGRIRPKERRPVHVAVEVSRWAPCERPALRWAFDPR